MSCRALFLTCLIAAAAGCQTTNITPQAKAPVVSSGCDAEVDGDAVTAAALVFDPPVVQEEPRLELSRADREPRVAIGYEGPVIERYYIRMDDRQINDGLRGFSGRGGGGGGVYDRYERRAVTERVGVRHR